jgi:hypothetical protein
MGLRVQLALRDTIGAVERALDASDDVVEKSNALADLCEGLDELWEYRDYREEQFGDLVNHLQLLLKGLKAEDFTPDQLGALKSVLVGVHVRPRLVDPDVRELEEHLVRSNLNIMRGLQ